MKFLNKKPLIKAVPTLELLQKVVHYAECKRIIDNLDRVLKEKSTKTITVVSFEAGEGRTTVAGVVALGWAALLNRRVLIVDASNPMSSWSLHDLLKNGASSGAGAIKDATAQPRELAPLVDIMPFSVSPLAARTQEYRVEDLVAQMSPHYDLILFDSAALRTQNRGNIDPWVLTNRTAASLLVTSVKSADLRQTLGREPVLKSRLCGMVECPL